ncbi:hypothetical protein Tco_1305283, partial [Tanacetum coccineum]
CQPRNHNFYEPNLCYNSNSSEFNQPQQYSIDHQPQSTQEDLNQQRMNDVLKAIQAVCEKLNQQEQAANVSTHTLEPSRVSLLYTMNDDDDDDARAFRRILILE